MNIITIAFEDLEVEIGAVTGYFDVEYMVYGAEPDVGIMASYTDWAVISPIQGTIANDEGTIITEFTAQKKHKLYKEIIDLLEYTIDEQCNEDAGI